MEPPPFSLPPSPALWNFGTFTIHSICFMSQEDRDGNPSLNPSVSSRLAECCSSLMQKAIGKCPSFSKVEMARFLNRAKPGKEADWSSNKSSPSLYPSFSLSTLPFFLFLPFLPSANKSDLEREATATSAFAIWPPFPKNHACEICLPRF